MDADIRRHQWNIAIELIKRSLLTFWRKSSKSGLTGDSYTVESTDVLVDIFWRCVAPNVVE